MPATATPSPKKKGSSSQSHHGQFIDIVVTRMAALEAKVEQLELQVTKLQTQLQEKKGSVKTNVSPQSKVTAAATSKKQKAKSPVKAAPLQEKVKPQGVSKKQNHDTPTKTLSQQQNTNLLVDLTPQKEDVHASPVKHPAAHKKTNIASSCAFVKVTGPMGGCEFGMISTADDHIAALQLDIDSEAGALWISSSIVKNDPEFLEMGVVFRTAQILPTSIQFERVIDTLLLPPAILDQLDDPNEVPPNLYYMTWKYYGCGADGFQQFQSTQAEFDQKDPIMKFYRHVLGHRQTVQVWFIADAMHVDGSFECLRARCYRELARDWQVCSGHEGNHGEYCPSMGNNRKGVAQFLQQSAPPS